MKSVKHEEVFDHPVFSVNPRKYHDFLNKYVEVSLKSDKISGFFESADPVSQSVVLIVPSGNCFRYCVIPGSSIANIVETTTTILQPNIMKESKLRITQEQLVHKKIIITEWLQKNLLPVKTEGDVINVYDGQVIIHPPYDFKNCITDNMIVLSRMQHLLKNVPS